MNMPIQLFAVIGLISVVGCFVISVKALIGYRRQKKNRIGAPVWYTKQGTRVKGPFTGVEICHKLVRGSISESDQVSQDGEYWFEVSTFVNQALG